MENFSLHLNPKRYILGGFVLTVPTFLFWSAVVYSVLTHNHRYVDEILSFGGPVFHIILVAGFPIASFALSIICRIGLRQQAIARNIWHRDTPEMRVNQSLINWNVMLISVMVISLINN